MQRRPNAEPIRDRATRMNLLLLSNSRNPGGEYLAHAIDAFAAWFDGRRRGWFVPFAGVTVPWDDYTRLVQAALAPLGVTITGAHVQPAPAPEDAMLVGGGNTFALLAECRRRGLLPVMAAQARAGTPYAGWSAGANLACPTIRTTNDMPIVDPGGFAALGLVPFQINPHYLDAEPGSTHMGETREARLVEYLEENAAPVLGLREGAGLRLQGRELELVGAHGARLFRRGKQPVEYGAGSDLAFLLEA